LEKLGLNGFAKKAQAAVKANEERKHEADLQDAESGNYD